MQLARRGRGPTAPNPCVGAVLVQDGKIVAEGWHTAYGDLHAERECLADAKKKGIDSSKCTMYVTLEPCNHHGKTPPCTDAILQARIPRLVIGAMDPTPEASGGSARLQAEGVEVLEGLLADECTDLIADFLHWRDTDRAYCILKMAATLDGKIASRTGLPEAVSSPESFQNVHRMRGFVDAVMVGGTTFRGDDPSLTCRLNETLDDLEQPYAVVVTSSLPVTGCDLKLIAKRPGKAVFLTTQQAGQSKMADALREIGVHVYGLPMAPNGLPGLDLQKGLQVLRSELGCKYVLCEGGGRLATGLVAQKAADEFVLYLAPRILGDDKGKSIFTGRDNVSMTETMDLRLSRSEPSGRDLKLVYMPK